MAAEDSTLWQKTKTGGKAGFDKLWGYADKLGAPVNKLSNKLGSEAFWPTTLDKESDKAARILRSFCKDGFYKEETKVPADGPKQKQRVIKKIPSEVIRNAKGLAIFTTMRTGLWVSGAGGSGIVVAKKEDGTWSPPTGILLHTAGLGFLIGVDIYDCVLVLNTESALEAFTKVRCTVGGEVSAVAGPVGAGGVLESELHTRRAPIFTYLKSRGFYAGVQIDGTVIVERTDENERFYGSKYSAKQILSGAASPPYGLRGLNATLKAAQGDTDVDESSLPSEPPPADFEVVQDGHVFGIPDKEDPDPFGVAALSKEGLEVRDATTHTPPADGEFEFRPKQDSPAYAIVNRRSTGLASPRKEAFASENHKRNASSDHSTQTDLGVPDASQVTESSAALAGGPIKLDDNETDIGKANLDATTNSETSARDSLEEVSLDEPVQRSPPKSPPLRRGPPPPSLPPRNPTHVPRVEPGAAETKSDEQTTPTGLDVSDESAEHETPEIHEDPEIKVLETKESSA